MDREKVIKGLEICGGNDCTTCPYKDEKDETYSGFCEQVLKRDILTLLKEQEAKAGKWIPIESPTGVEAFGVKEMTVMNVRCSVCGSEEDVSFTGYKYCPRCGAKMDA